VQVVRHDADQMHNGLIVALARVYEGPDDVLPECNIVERRSIATVDADRDMPGRSFNAVCIEWQALPASAGHVKKTPLARSRNE